eukprot:CAMPEP_0172495692 /NCGR_PEP_ID=MMETSP1066-20121228/74817_1 /TAXON_ID=671091 /ORGANISM="Coscinodiscus wailesii, Strain CCMP2513" /LENGTH=589 /DNA_ID=CAMNT_0013267531 /DNA_START=132 /DNA_END=1901 /DNA_ORIENTATION=-
MLLRSAATALITASFFGTVVTQNETNATTCNFCPEGLPDKDKYSDVWNMTCGEISAYAKLTSPLGCETMFLPATIECGCSYEIPEGNCDICPEGLDYPDDPVWSLSGIMPYNLTCSGLVGISTMSNESHLCDSYAGFAAADCGCPVPEGYVLCDVPRGTVPEPDRFSEELNTTCGEFADMIHYGPAMPNERCDMSLQFLSSVCGPETIECAFCPEGYELQYPDAIYDNETNAVCRDFVLNVTKTPGFDNSEMSCNIGRSTYFNTGAYPYPCGFCVPTTSSTERCDMCADGSVPTGAAEDPAMMADNGVMSCGQVSYSTALQSQFMKTSTFLGDLMCITTQDAVAITCGCSAETSSEPCSVCGPDGPADPDVAVGQSRFGGALTCGEVSEAASNIPGKSLTCAKMQYSAEDTCDCTSPDVETCGSCPGGMTVSGYTETSLGQNCIWLESSLLGVPADHRICKTGASVFAAECCPEMCNPCPDGFTASEDTVTKVSGLTCGALANLKVPANDALCLEKGPIVTQSCCPHSINDTGSVDDPASEDRATDGNTTDSITNNTGDAILQELASDAVLLRIAGNIVFTVITIVFLF